MSEAFTWQFGRDVAEGELQVVAWFRDLCEGRDMEVVVAFDVLDLNRQLIREEESVHSVSAGKGGVLEFREAFAAEMDEIRSLRSISARHADPCEDLAAGNPYAASGALASLHWKTGLGRLNDGKSAGALRLEHSSWATLQFSPADLSFHNPAPGQIEVVKQSGMLRQIATPGDLADIQIMVEGEAYEIAIYKLSDCGAPDADDIRIPDPGTTPHTRYRIERVLAGSEERLRVTENPGAAEKIREFAFRDDITGGDEFGHYYYGSYFDAWEQWEGNGARRTTRAENVVSGPVYTEYEMVRDASDAVLTVKDREYEKVLLGGGSSPGIEGINSPYTLRRIRGERVYTGSATVPAEEIRYDYDEDPLSPNYGRLISKTDSRGPWEEFYYDSQGRMERIERGYLNSTPDDPDAPKKVAVFGYETVPDMDGDGKAEALESVAIKFLGVETARSYTLEMSGPVTLNGHAVRETRTIRAAAPGAAWDNASNPVTREWEYADETSEFYKLPYARLGPDGTGRVIARTRNGDGTLTMVEGSGILDSEVFPTGIISGTVTTRQYTARTELLFETKVDVQSGLTIAASVFSDWDDRGRPRRTDYLDGTYETRTYACCGLQSVTGPDGVETTYDYDALGRINDTTTAIGTAAQWVRRSVFDAAGNLVASYAGGDTSSLSKIAEHDYDYGGGLTASRTRFLDAVPSPARETTYAKSVDIDGFRIETTTYPNGSTRVEKRYPDGTNYEISGTAVRNVRYDYGVEPDATLGYPARTETLTYLKADGSLSGNYTKDYRDALGHVYKTEAPAPKPGRGVATTSRTFDSAGRPKTVTDPDGQVVIYEYDGLGRETVTAVDANGNETIDYDGTDRVRREQMSYGIYDDGGDSRTVEVRTVEVWPGATAEIISQTKTTLDSNAAGSFLAKTWITEYGQTHVAVTEMDRGAGTRTQTTDFPDDSRLTNHFEYGQLKTAERLLGAEILSKQHYFYDADKRVQTVTDLYRGDTVYDYYADGQLKSVTTPDPDAALAGSGYDVQATGYAYTDAVGNISRTVTLPDLTTRTETFYPTGGLKEASGSQTYPVQYAYDHAGRVLSQTTWQDKASGAGEVRTAWEYYPGGQLKQKWYGATVHPDGSITGRAGEHYAYTPAGRVEARTNARGTQAQYAYDPDSLDLTGISYDDGLTPAVTYGLHDHLGRPTRITDASGTRTLDYEKGQLMDENYLVGVLSGHQIDRRLDGFNRLDRLELSRDGSVIYLAGYVYDGASRLKTVDWGGHSVSYTYFPGGDVRERRTFNNGTADILTVELRRDKLNRLVSVDSTALSGFATSHAYRYNDLNQRIQMTSAHGTSWQYGYDALGQVVSAGRYTGSGAAIPGYDYGYTFDDIGNRTLTTSNARAAAYQPNQLNQYEQREVPRALDVRGSATPGATVTVAGQSPTREGDYFYQELDLSGSGDRAQQVDILVTASLADGGDNNAPRIADGGKSQYLPPTPEVFTHDADGNRIEDGRWHYYWDAENRLIAMETLPVAYTAGAPRQRIEFSYDSQGRRFSKNVHEWDGAAYVLSNSSLFIYDGWNLIAEIDAPPSSPSVLQTSYVWGTDASGTLYGAGGVGGLLMATDHRGTADSTYFPNYDGNGNVVGYYAAETGEPVALFEYGPFGEPLRMTGNRADRLSFRFSTKYEDAETGLLYYGFRYYDSQSGRWLSRDPLGEFGFVRTHLVGGERLPEGIAHLWALMQSQSDEVINPYWMVGNDPVNEYDRMGLQAGRGGTRNKCLSKGSGWKWAQKPNGVVPPNDGCSVPFPLNRLWNRNDPTGGSASIVSPCNNHDSCYSDCSKTKSDCDMALYDDIVTVCEMRAVGMGRGRQGFLNRCRRWAWIYYQAVKVAGLGPYSTRQNLNCHCECTTNP